MRDSTEFKKWQKKEQEKEKELEVENMQKSF